MKSLIENLTGWGWVTAAHDLFSVVLGLTLCIALLWCIVIMVRSVFKQWVDG